MRKTAIIAIMVLLAPGALAGVEPEVKVEKVQPNPAIPGETLKMFLVVENSGTERGSFEALEVESPEGIEFAGTTSDIGEGFELCGGCQTTGTLYFQISEDLTSGSYPIDLKVGEGDTGIVEKYELEVDGSPELLLISREFSVLPGGSATVEVEISNIGTGGASQVTLQPSTKQFGMDPSVLSLGRIEAGETVTRTVNMSADKSLDSGLKTVKVSLSFRDESRMVKRNASLKANILERADLVISDFSTDNPVIGKEAVVTVEVENLGPGEAERIVSNLKCKGAEISSEKSFVGVLGDEESVPLTFTLTPDKEKISCTVNVKYTDNRRKTLSESFSFSASEKSSGLLPVIVFLVIIGLAGYIWRKRRKDELEEI